MNLPRHIKNTPLIQEHLSKDPSELRDIIQPRRQQSTTLACLLARKLYREHRKKVLLFTCSSNVPGWASASRVVKGRSNCKKTKTTNKLKGVAFDFVILDDPHVHESELGYINTKVIRVGSPFVKQNK